MQARQQHILLCLSLLIITAFVSSCATRGDFGRPRQLKIQEIATAYAADIMMGAGLLDANQKPGFHKGDPFGLTKPEILVRDASVHFSQPLTKGVAVHGERISPSAYAEYMTRGEFTHGESRIGFISSQIKSDFVWLKRFDGAARKVKIDDGERAVYLETTRIGLNDQDRIRTYSRIKENEEIVFDIFKEIDDRISSYTYAIKRIPLEIPGTSVEELKMALKILRKAAAESRVQYDKLARRIARRRVNLARRWKARLKRRREAERKASSENMEGHNGGHRGSIRGSTDGQGSQHGNHDVDQLGRGQNVTRRPTAGSGDVLSEKPNSHIRRTNLKLITPKSTKSIISRPPIRKKVMVPVIKPKKQPVHIPAKREKPTPEVKENPEQEKWPMVIVPNPGQP